MSREKFQLFAVACTVISTYLSAQMCYFVMDQYTYYKHLEIVGLPYGKKHNRNICRNESLAPGNDSSPNNWAQSQTARLNSLSSFLAIGIGILMNLVIGYLSDRFGRRPALLTVLSGIFVQMGLSALIVGLDANPWWRLLPSIVEGLLGGGLMSATAQFSALLVDIEQQISSHTRSQHSSQPGGRLMRYWLRLTYLDGFISTCLSGGSALGGAFVYRLGFPLTAGINLVFFAPTMLFFWFLPFSKTPPTSQHPGEVLPASDQTDSIKVKLQSGILVVCKRWFWAVVEFVSTGHRLSNLSIAILFPIALAYMLEHSFLFLYLMSPPICWNSEDVGLWNGLMGAACNVLSMFVISVIYCRHRRRSWSSPVPSSSSSTSPDEATGDLYQKQLTRATGTSTAHHTLLFCSLRFSLVFLLASRLVLGSAYLLPQPIADGLVYLSLILRLPKSMIFPALRTIVASVCLPGTQGRTFAALGFWQRLGNLISMSILPNVYAATLMTFKAAAFVVCASLLAIALLLTISLDWGLHQGSTTKPAGNTFVTLEDNPAQLKTNSSSEEQP